MLPIQKKLIKYNISRRSSVIKYLVIHDTGNKSKGANALAHYNYFNGGNRNSSADYFVDDSNIIQLVEDNNYSYHCGDGKGRNGITNNNSIGIEICINSDGDYNKAVSNTIELVKCLMEKYNIGIDKVVRHFDASFKLCPQSMSANSWSKWNEFKNRLTTDTTKEPVTTPYCLEFQRLYNTATKTSAPIKEDNIYGENTEKAFQVLLPYIKGEKKSSTNYCLEFQKFFNRVTQTKKPITEDGIYGNQTEKALEILHTIIKKF